MNKIYKLSLASLALVLFQNNLQSQCATTATLGSATNMYTMLRNGTNPIAADKNLNTIVLAHRNNATAFGGSSGNLRYDVSMNGGTTWTNNVGPLNPTLTNPARYPNAVIYNPAGNVVPANAYLGYLAATVNTVTNGWNGPVTGIRQLNGTGNTESYQNTPNALIANSLNKGAPGIFWAVDAVYTSSLVTGFRIYKGTWNGTNDITWATNFTVTPALSTAFNGTAQVADYNIAFDPTGTYGWMSFLGHLNTGPTNYAYYPIFYKTTDGGTSWTGPIQVDLNQFPCATSILTGTNVLTTAFEHDLAVDVYGNPHMLTTLCNGSNAYSIYFASTHHVFDITSQSGMWNAYDLANVNAGRGGWGTSPTNSVTMDMQPQIARTADGNKIFYSWSDNTTYTLGAANQSPNLKAMAFDVTTLKRTNVKDFTSCNVATNGLAIFPHIASEVLEPSTTSYKLAGAYAAFTTPNDPSMVTNLKYLDNLIFNSTDFTNTQPTVSVSIQQGYSWLLCPTNTLGLSITGTYTQVLWNNAATTNSTSVSTGSTYIVTVRNGCVTGADTIYVTNLIAPVNSPPICIGNSSTLTILGNAFSYTWSVGASTATSIVVSPTVNSVYSFTATGTNCTYPQTVSVTVNPLPTLTVSGSSTVCAGLSVTETASGASTYTWNTGATGASVSLSPTGNTTYTVTGTDINSCVNTQTTSLTVLANPTVSIAGSNTVCTGSSLTLTASGAPTFTWDSGATTANIAVTPTAATVYSVTGTATNQCTDTKTFSVSIITLPTIGITSSASLICSGASASLTGSGASTFTWSTGSNLMVISVTPTSNSTYTLNASASNGCSNSATFTQSVSTCTGINPHGNQTAALIIFPNPNNGEFTIQATGEITLIITNGLGQTIKELNLTDTHSTVEVRDLPKGIYFVAGKNSSTTFRNKLIVN